jgi:hypothetical protein
VVIDDLDIGRIAIPPAEADPPLVVDPDAVLTLAVSVESLQSIPRRNAEVIKRCCRIQHPKLPQCDPLHVRSQSFDPLSAEQPLSVPVSEAPDHAV